MKVIVNLSKSCSSVKTFIYSVFMCTKRELLCTSDNCVLLFTLLRYFGQSINEIIICAFRFIFIELKQTCVQTRI